MKIISKMHDYYDTVTAYGVSPVYYHRTPEELHVKGDALGNLMHNASCWGGRPAIVLFCGQVFGVIILQNGAYKPETFLVTKEEDFETYRKIYEDSLGSMARNWPRLDPKANCYRSPQSYAVRGFSGFLDDIKGIDAECYHREFNSPILLITSSPKSYQGSDGRWKYMVSVYRDAQLKEFGFHKVKDAFTAYQEIDSYLSGVLGVEFKPPVEISDVHRLEGHGFDKKTSFRKMKG